MRSAIASGFFKETSHMTSKWMLSAAAVLGAAGFFAACSSKQDGPPDISTLASALAGSFCGALQGCCDQKGWAYDEGSCKAQMTYEYQSAIDAYKRGKVNYEPSAFAECADAIKNRESKCSADAGAPPGAESGFVDPIARACWKLLRGTVAPGDECAESLECAAPGPEFGATCERQPNSDKRVCKRYKLHVLPGGECSFRRNDDVHEASMCEPTQGYCSVESADAESGTCVAFAKMGESCRDGNKTIQCEKETYCDWRAGDATCKALPGEGEECTSSQCAQGNYCDFSSRKCIALKEVGESCKSSSECASRSCETTFSPDGGSTTGKCAPTTGGYNDFHISPRTCGFGPNGRGDDDAGIVKKNIEPRADKPWYLVR
jgi:hypothetical protein